jgi:hypothetical protein
VHFHTPLARLSSADMKRFNPFPMGKVYNTLKRFKKEADRIGPAHFGPLLTVPFMISKRSCDK